MYTHIAYELFPGLVELTLTCAKKSCTVLYGTYDAMQHLRGAVLCSTVRHSGPHSALDRLTVGALTRRSGTKPQVNVHHHS